MTILALTVPQSPTDFSRGLFALLSFNQVSSIFQFGCVQKRSPLFLPNRSFDRTSALSVGMVARAVLSCATSEAEKMIASHAAGCRKINLLFALEKGDVNGAAARLSFQ